MEWNNVNDTLPNVQRLLLVRSGGTKKRAFYTGTGWIDTGGTPIAGVTHWRTDPETTVEFTMYHEGAMVDVRVESAEDYVVYFNDEIMTDIEQDDDGLWIDEANRLDEDVVEYIGGRITSHFM